MTSSSTVAADAARQGVLQSLRDRFPGIRDVRAVRPAGQDHGALVGSWNGQWVGVSHSYYDSRPLFLVYARCTRCGRFQRILGMSADQLAYLEHDPPTTEVGCVACTELYVAQEAARRCRTRLSRWWFRLRFGESVEQVLARRLEE